MAGNWLKLRLCARAGSTEAPPVETTKRFGALTGAGEEDLPVTGTSILTGDPLGHWQVSGGMLTPSSAGDAANLSGAPYSLFFNDLSSLRIEVDPDAYGVGKAADWDRVAKLDGALAGKTIYVREGLAAIPWTVTNSASSNLGRFNYSPGVVIESRDLDVGSTFSGELLLTSRFITFRGINWEQGAGRKVTLNGDQGSFPVNDITFYKCKFPFPAVTLTAHDVSMTFTNSEAIVGTGTLSNINVMDCTFDWAKSAVALGAAGNCTIAGNQINVYWVWAFQFSHPRNATHLLEIYDNVIRNPVGRSSDNLAHPDAMLFSASSDVPCDWYIKVNRNRMFAGAAIGGQPGPRGGSRGQVGPVAFRDNVKPAGDGGISSVSKANPGVIVTTSNHGFSTGDLVIVANIASMTQLNGTYKAVVTNATTLTLTTLAGTPIDTTAFTTYVPVTSGGNPQQVIFKDSGYFFVVEAIGNLHHGGEAASFQIENSKDCVVLNNTVVSDASGGVTVQFTVGRTTNSGTSRVERNISELFSFAGCSTLDNITVGRTGPDYAALFDGSNWQPSTLAEAMTVYRRKDGSSADLPGAYDAGAIGSGAVAFATTSPGADGVNYVS